MDQTREIDIDLKRIFFMLRKKVILIVLITLLGGIISGVYTEVFIEPTYTSSVKMYVYSNTDRVSTDSSISESEISASQQLVNTYLVILKSDTVLEKVKSELDLNVTTSSLRSMIGASQIEDTVAFKVTVVSTNPQLAADIANTVAEVAPNEIVRVVKAGGVEVIDYAKVPSKASAPNLTRNILIGLLAGLLLSFCYFFIKELFNTTITNERDIQREFTEIPVLGTIPVIVGSNDKNDKTNDKAKGV